jgi:hypothetical protein
MNASIRTLWKKVVYSERFKTPQEAQKFIDEALRA